MKERKAIRKGLVFGMILALIAVVFVGLPMNVSATPTTIYVDDVAGSGPGNPAEDYTSIQDAVDAASSGDTIYVYAGTYYENVVIDTTLTLEGENKDTTIIQGYGRGYGIYSNSVLGITIRNIKIQGFVNGISLYYCTSSMLTCNTITGNVGSGINLRFSGLSTLISNRVTSNKGGINLVDSSGSILTTNIVTDHIGFGIQLTRCSSSILTSNMVTDNYDGIYLSSSSSSTLTGNTFSSNSRYGIFLQSGCLYCTLTSNTVAGNYWGIYLSSSRITMTDNTVTGNTKYGIKLYAAHNSMIAGNTIAYNGEYGIYSGAQYCTFTGNTIKYNGDNGIHLRAARYSTLNSNTVTFNSGYGIYLYVSLYQTIAYNIITNNDNGIYIRSGYCTISDNIVTANSDIGIYLSYSAFNTIARSDLANNDYGVYSLGSHSNSLYHNNFIGNTYQVNSDSLINTWDNDYPSGGNYWSDYTGSDVKNGPNQDISGSDGIGDTPYIINLDNQDNYPLMDPWGPDDSIEELIEDIEGMELPTGTENNLVAKLEDAIKLFEKENTNGAIHKLGDFIDYVKAQRGKKLTEDQADELIAAVKWIIYLITV